eukprot:CAMPEP_0194397696 /NCGR_PEP_ID=MMETSP0174-20130528/125687_1 /TAXON_ID=216777 /ORGANISM="Proboscia alata, Strain PI-D3" /LENGTH=140 /DNA_ID=CAMNT_0039193901 /DNA_START=684 /DNA_END=1107 /DNA_ORIENTATION=-
MKRENGALINIKMSHDGKTAAHPFETALHSSDADLSLLQSSSLVGSSAGPTVSPSTLQSVARIRRDTRNNSGWEQTAEGYSWTQTNDEIEIWVPISATLKPICDVSSNDAEGLCQQRAGVVEVVRTGGYEWLYVDVGNHQ